MLDIPIMLLMAKTTMRVLMILYNFTKKSTPNSLPIFSLWRHEVLLFVTVYFFHFIVFVCLQSLCRSYSIDQRISLNKVNVINIL